jgi:hypothetical protein
MGFISSLSSSYLQAALGTVLQATGLTSKGAGSSSAGSTSATESQPDNQQLSPLAQITSSLEQLQQSNPSQYQQVTQQIATNLQNASQTAQAEGNTTAASQLNQLATDFTNASQSGQQPNMQDLAQAMSGHHRHSHGASSDSDSSSSADSASSSASSSTSSSTPGTSLSQLLAAFQTGGSQSDSLNPVSIIMNTLSNAGI